MLTVLAIIGPAWAGEVVFPGDRWQKADPASQRVDAAKLEAAVEYLKAHSGGDGVGELVIVRLGLDQSDHEISDEEYGEFFGKVGRPITGAAR